ncbi:MAG TPA: beta-galactosidase, partial [Dysgonamonadaceae bacterium]|nr:beta-galactosidase [Dysgonamonadaceae bacterium]
MKTKNLKIYLLFILLLSITTGVQGQKKHERIEKGFFPFSVWYSGGKARAPMLSEITTDSEEEWRADLQQIKDLGFNTVRTWVEWATCEPEPGKYNFDN